VEQEQEDEEQDEEEEWEDEEEGGDQEQEEVERAKWAAADALADLLFSVIAVQKPAVVEAAAADLCRALLAAWLGAQEQLRQEREDAVVGAVQLVAAGGRCKETGTNCVRTAAGLAMRWVGSWWSSRWRW
jgi:hypothetical protein